MTRRGVVLLQFGGPDSKEAIRPFLRDLFEDREILPYPAIVRVPLARLISTLRAPKVARNYALIGGASPIGSWTEKQADGVRRALPDAVVTVAMRSWKPNTEEAVRKLVDDGVTDLLALPLYPQYSHTTTRSSLAELARQVRRLDPGNRMRVRTVRSWPTHPGYVAATVATVRRELAKFDDPPFVLFDAHGLPMRVVSEGDPYPHEVEATVGAVVAALSLPHHRWSLSYQSRVGYLEWLRPYTEHEIPRLAAAGVRSMLVVPMSFVCDHYETLYEMRILLGDVARAAGIERYEVVPALNDEPLFLDALADLARRGFAGESVDLREAAA